MAKKTVTSLKNVFSAGIAAGIKANGKKDLAYLFDPHAYGCAGVFTQSAFIAQQLGGGLPIDQADIDALFSRYQNVYGQLSNE